MRFYVIDKTSNEKMRVQTMKYRNGKLPSTVEVLANATSEKGGITSYDIRRINLNEKVKDGGKSMSQLENRYMLIIEDEL
ncbi:hypothetical protein [Listeria booriae]|uniref:hypothetical protein n=1 Tax=Listeria booriae TaxID=1552123 RepID=UPI00162AA223|nr:hypothetical protein [Listeria booriae]MBC2391340.1 hypothetical protein [Listeria booriae]